MTSPPQQHQRNDGAARHRVIVLPDSDVGRPLAEEFGEYLSVETIERAVAAARHALERSHQPATADAVKRLAREQLQARVATLAGRGR